MNTSLAAVFHGADRELELRQIPTPAPSNDDVLVRVVGCTLCGSDLHTFDGRRSTPLPTVLGHEIVGTIEAIAPDSKARDVSGDPLQIGDRITWGIVANCGRCFYCLRALPQKCSHGIKYGHEAIQPGQELRGGLAEHCLLAPGTAMVKLPAALPLAVATPASCATATIAAALKAIPVISNADVCVFGAGMLGLTACSMLQVMGAAKIVCVELDARRRDQALRFGATHAVTPDELPALVNDFADQNGFDAALELSGSPAAVEVALQTVRLGGSVVLVGSVFPTPPVAIAPDQIVRRNLSIHGVHNYGPEDLVDAVQFLTAHHDRFPFETLVAQWLPLSAVAEAFQLSRDPVNIRIGVLPDGAP